MTDEELLQEIMSLPLEGQRQVIEFITFLRQRYEQGQSSGRYASKLSSEGFVGMWQDREDLNQSSEWMRRSREAEWIN
jgi:hypothetical protein